MRKYSFMKNTNIWIILVFTLFSVLYLALYFIHFNVPSDEINDYSAFATYLSGLGSIASIGTLIFLLFENNRLQNDNLNMQLKFENERKEQEFNKLLSMHSQIIDSFTQGNYSGKVCLKKAISWKKSNTVVFGNNESDTQYTGFIISLISYFRSLSKLCNYICDNFNEEEQVTYAEYISLFIIGDEIEMLDKMSISQHNKNNIITILKLIPEDIQISEYK